MASEKKYIELEVAKETILNYIGEQTVSKYPSSELCRASRMGAEGAMYELEYAPTADVAEVRHGRWIINDEDYWTKCSVCEFEYLDEQEHIYNTYRYCPHCGARMDGDDGETVANKDL